MLKTISVSFLNIDGLKLFGILHQPSIDRFKGKAIIILSPGIKSRVAPHRLYVKMARKFVAMGFHVLRFDFSGLGDSEGIVEHENVADFYGSIQIGKYIADTKAAMDFLSSTYNVKKFILAGLCGGAITGLLTGAQDSRVDSLIGLAIPVILDGAHVDQEQFITQGQLQSLTKGYVNKLFDIKSWMRLLTFQSNYRMILKLVRQIFHQKKNNNVKNDVAPAERSMKEQGNDNFNWLFPQAFFDMTSSSRKILLVFSGSDRLGWEFEEKFALPYKERLDGLQQSYELHTILDANHILSFPEWQDEFFSITTNWLIEKYSSTM